MSYVYVIIGGGLIIAGSIAGILTVIAVGIHREEEASTRTTDGRRRSSLSRWTP